MQCLQKIKLVPTLVDENDGMKEKRYKRVPRLILQRHERVRCVDDTKKNENEVVVVFSFLPGVDARKPTNAYSEDI